MLSRRSNIFTPTVWKPIPEPPGPLVVIPPPAKIASAAEVVRKDRIALRTGIIEMWKDRVPAKKIAIQFDIDVGAVRYTIQKHREKSAMRITTEGRAARDQKISLLWLSGGTIKAIAKDAQCTVSIVESTIGRLGLWGKRPEGITRKTPKPFIEKGTIMPTPPGKKPINPMPSDPSYRPSPMRVWRSDAHPKASPGKPQDTQPSPWRPIREDHQ